MPIAADANFLKDKTEAPVVASKKSKSDAVLGPATRSPSPKASGRVKRTASWKDVGPEDDDSSSKSKKKSKKKPEDEPEEDAEDKPPKLRMTWVGRACLWVMLVGSIPALRVAIGSFVCRPFDLQEWPQVPASALEAGEYFGEAHVMSFGYRSMAKPDETSLFFDELEVPEPVRVGVGQREADVCVCVLLCGGDGDGYVRKKGFVDAPFRGWSRCCSLRKTPG